MYNTSGSGLGNSRARSRQAASGSRPKPRTAARVRQPVEQLVDGDVLFGGPGPEHDPVQLPQAGVAADGVFELA